MAAGGTTTADPGCPYCSAARERIVDEQGCAIAVRDRFPVTPGHTLVIPTRHVASWWDTTAAERSAIAELLDRQREVLAAEHRPDGFTIGINDGTAAGQTVFHVHIHLIPRYRGDVADPTGGVRAVIPGAGRYPGASRV